MSENDLEFDKQDLSIEENPKKRKRIKFDLEEFVFRYRYSVTFLLLGAILLGFGIIYFKNTSIGTSDKIEVLEEVTESPRENSEIVVEVSGAVENPGVYKLPATSRVEDALIAAGGISASADRDWMEKMVNRAGKLSDGQKIYIPSFGEQSNNPSANNSGGTKVYQNVQGSTATFLVNINSASQRALEDLPGIGPVYAQSIIEHRPYSNVEELVSKRALKQGVYEKIKDLVTVY